MVIDCFTYNGEKDMLKLHLSVLEPHVDRFIICEAKTTFSGYKKPLYFMRDEKEFQQWWKRIDYHIIPDTFTEAEIQLAESSPNTVGATHWKTEFLQKENIHKALAHAKLKDDDVVYIGDVDEIWQPYDPSKGPAKLKLLVYAYYLDNLSSEEFWGTLCAYYGDIRYDCLNHLRSDTSLRTQKYYGWHFTSMGGFEEVRRKLNDSYTAESYNTLAIQEALPERFRKGQDYLGRPFEFSYNTSLWPTWLQVNSDQFAHMCKPKFKATNIHASTLTRH